MQYEKEEEYLFAQGSLTLWYSIGQACIFLTLMTNSYESIFCLFSLVPRWSAMFETLIFKPPKVQYHIILCIRFRGKESRVKYEDLLYFSLGYKCIRASSFSIILDLYQIGLWTFKWEEELHWCASLLASIEKNLSCKPIDIIIYVLCNQSIEQIWHSYDTYQMLNPHKVSLMIRRQSRK